MSYSVKYEKKTAPGHISDSLNLYSRARSIADHYWPRAVFFSYIKLMPPIDRPCHSESKSAFIFKKSAVFLEISTFLEQERDWISKKSLPEIFFLTNVFVILNKREDRGEVCTSERSINIKSIDECDLYPKKLHLYLLPDEELYLARKFASQNKCCMTKSKFYDY